MTTPGQSLPATIETLLGVGAYQIGSGGQPSGFGQNVADDFVMNLVRGAAPGLFGGITGAAGAIEALGSFLTTLPLEVLQAFQAFMPGTALLTDFLDTATSVSTILGGILVNPMARLVSVVQQLLGILSGDVVVPLNAGVQAAKDWFTGLPGEIVSGAAAAVQGLKDLLTGIENATDADVQAWLNAVAEVESGIQAIRDAIVNALGGLSSGYSASDVQAFLGSIPNTNVIGQWQSTLQDDLATFQGAISTGITDTSASIAGMTSALSGIASLLGFSTNSPPPPSSVSGMAQTSAEFITMQAAAHPTFLGLDPTADAVFNVDKLLGVSPLPMVQITQAGGTLVGFITVQHGGAAGSDPATWAPKKSVEWIGFPTGGDFSSIDAIYLVLNKMDAATGIQSEVYTSPNIVSTLTTGTTKAWNSYNIPALNYIVPQQGDVYGVEMILCGAGTYNVGGVISDIPEHPTWPGMHAATRASTFNTVSPSYVGAGAYTVGTAPTLDHVAGGPAITTTTNTPDPITWTHNISANANLAVIGVSFGNTGGTAFTVTCGGQTMTSAAATWQYSLNHYTQYFYLVNPPTGSSVAMSVSYTGGNNWIACESWSVIGASGVGTPINNSGSGTSLTQTVTNTENTLLLNMMCASPSSGTIGSYNKSQDANCGYATNSTYPTVFGHTAGSASSITFTCAATTTSGWGSTVLPILGIAPSTISWTQNTNAGDYVTAAAEVGLFGLGATPTATVTCGGVAMTLLQTKNINNVGTNGIVAIYGMSNAPGGNQTIVVTPAVSSGKIQSVAGNSVSYANVRGVGVLTTGYGATTSMSVAATGIASGLVFNALGSNVPAAAADTAYSATSRWVTPTVTGINNALLQIGDSATTGAFNVTATQGGSYTWGGINAVLLPTPVIPSTIASPTWSANVPEFLLCGSVGTTVYPPYPVTFTSSGSWTPPPWANNIDIAGAGGGGGGASGAGIAGGNGGTESDWTTLTLTKGQWTEGAAWTITIGAGGGAYASGSPTTIVIPGYGTVTTGHGNGGSGSSGNSYARPGGSMSNETYNGPSWTGAPTVYYGGGGGPAPQAAGGQPGGGGAGGNSPVFPGTYIYGGGGGPGTACFLAYL